MNMYRHVCACPPEMAYFPVTFCQGFGAEFGRLNSEVAQKSKLFLPLNFLCYGTLIESVCP